MFLTLSELRVFRWETEGDETDGRDDAENKRICEGGTNRDRVWGK